MNECDYEVKILEINDEVCISKVFKNEKIITYMTFNSKKEFEDFNCLYSIAKDDYFKQKKEINKN